MSERRLVIALDGPSGAGKSTAGRALAERLGYTFIDTGAMYRALALKALRARVAVDDGEALAALLVGTRIELSDAGRNVALDGEDVSAAIRTREVSDAASRVAAHRAVRRAMVARQQQMGRAGGVVMDGRDIGTAVFPQADVKFYVLADPARRAERRHRELQAAGQVADLEAIEQDVRERDRRDSTRAESPLVRAHDAVDVDTTELGPEQVVDQMLALVHSRIATAPVR
ncbi:MAG: (d)CMP kinase [Vicinamibacteria bacterium]|nr:(d)CMP kinase [Vicinamibacteria bacterium]